MSDFLDVEQIRELLRERVYDPELGVNIVDLGLVYDVENINGEIKVTMTLTTPGCPAHDAIAGGVNSALEPQPGVRSVEVEIVWEPAWHPEMMTQRAKEELGYF